MGRNVMAVINIKKRYLTCKWLVPSASIPYDPLKLAALPMKEWARKSLDATNENKLMRMSI